MANFRNDWEALLENYNKELKANNIELRVLTNEDGFFDIHIVKWLKDGSKKEETFFAENNFENELSECLTDAFHHVMKQLTSTNIKVNDDEHYESINVILSRKKTPIAFQNKLNELMEEGAFENEEEAIKWIETNPIELELYYEKGNGLFAVESGAVESRADLVSPYTKAEFEYEEI